MERDKLTLRLPPDLKAEIQRHAEQDLRSLNEEIVVLLRRALAGYRQLHRSSP